jgi:hypothetical protein
MFYLSLVEVAVEVETVDLLVAVAVVLEASSLRIKQFLQEITQFKLAVVVEEATIIRTTTEKMVETRRHLGLLQ